MNPFLLPPAERLAHWKDFRQSLANRSETDQLQACAAYWSHTPLLTIAYDLDDYRGWPSPWEMIHAGQWDRNTVAIGIEFTLRLAGWQAERLRLRYLNDRVNCILNLVCEVDRRQMLNYEWGRVAGFPCRGGATIRAFQFRDKGYVEI